jgi:hypothetical protein
VRKVCNLLVGPTLSKKSSMKCRSKEARKGARRFGANFQSS